MKITIDYLEQEANGKWKGWCVTHGNTYADGLGYEEMLGLVTAITLPDKRPCLQWLKTKEQHRAWKDKFSKKRK